VTQTQDAGGSGHHVDGGTAVGGPLHIPQHRHTGQRRQSFFDELQPLLARYLGLPDRESGQIATGMREAGDAHHAGIARGDHDNRDHRRCPLRGARCVGPGSEHDIGLFANRVNGKRHEVLCNVGPSTIDHEVLSLDPAEVAELLCERSIFRCAYCR
jgi:hypothetical protein